MHGNVTPGAVSGTIQAPASKSAFQRAVAMSVLADGTSTIHNPSHCADALAALEMARCLGAHITEEPGRVLIAGSGQCRNAVLHAGESGLGLRMFASVAACFDGSITLEATGSLNQRPVGMLVDGLSQLQVPCRTADGLPPVTVTGPLKPGTVELDGSITSQVLSGLLIALSAVDGRSEVRVRNLTSRPYVRMTVDMLRAFGGEIQWTPDDVFKVHGKHRLRATEMTVEGDWSGAAALLCAGAIAGDITVTGVSATTLQADRAVLNALEQIGAKVAVEPDRVRVSRDALRPFTFDVTDCPDLVPVLTAVALCGSGDSRFTGTGRLQYKESHRPNMLAEQFARLGGRVRVVDDEMIVSGGSLSGGDVSACGDHRIAMALAVAALRADGPVVITGVDCVNKSYPGFFRDLRTLQHPDGAS